MIFATPNAKLFTNYNTNKFRKPAALNLTPMTVMIYFCSRILILTLVNSEDPDEMPLHLFAKVDIYMFPI